MTAPISDFIRDYIARDPARLHMPGHKGAVPDDITEIFGADSLYEAEGIILESERNAASLFGSARTLYGTEGSSQCVKAMVFLAARKGPILAARNAHQSFIHGAALCGARVEWLYPKDASSPYSALIDPKDLEAVLDAADEKPAALYVTSPDYLGREQDLKALSAVCRVRGLLLLCDNAHGAYLKFLSPSRHPLDAGADLVCDSAHKTLPVLTGGAYLHIGPGADADILRDAKTAMALFGSSSPSWLILKSLDENNGYLEADFPRELEIAVKAVREEKDRLSALGWGVLPSDEMRICLAAAEGADGLKMAGIVRRHGAECEFADRDVLVAMYSPRNRPQDFAALSRALGRAPGAPRAANSVPHRPEKALEIREAVFSRWEETDVRKAAGRVCALPLPHCPPAVPPVMPGERIDDETVRRLTEMGIGTIRTISAQA